MCETYTYAFLQCTGKETEPGTHPKPYSEISSELHLRNVHVHEMSSTQHAYVLNNVGYHTITYAYCVHIRKINFLSLRKSKQSIIMCGRRKF